MKFKNIHKIKQHLPFEIANNRRSCTIIIIPSLSTSSFLRFFTYTFASKDNLQLAISRIVGSCNISFK